MNIWVCVKQVPDTDSVLFPQGSDIDRSRLPYVINPYDEFSIEEALKIREQFPGTVVTLLTVGPLRVEEALRHGLAMGADVALRICLEQESLDPLVVARLLAAVLKQRTVDLVFCGKQAVDDDSALVGAALAGILNWPHVSVVRKVTAEEKIVVAEKETDGGVEIDEVQYPAVLTTQLGLNQPRFASLPGKLRAKKVLIEQVDATRLGVDLTPTVNVERLDLPPQRLAGRMLAGSAVTQVQTLLDALRQKKLLP